MTNKQLVEKLQRYPDNLEVFIGRIKGEFDYDIVDDLTVIDMSFSEDPDGKPMAKDRVILIKSLTQ